DPRRHEALAMIPRMDFDDQQVIEQMQKGYEHAGRLLRPALVKVVSNPGPAADAGPAAPAAPAAPGEEESGWDGGLESASARRTRALRSWRGGSGASSPAMQATARPPPSSPSQRRASGSSARSPSARR